jgi:hypothetical protein
MPEIQQAAGCKHGNQYDKDSDFLFHGRSRSQMKIVSAGAPAAVMAQDFP